jgi:hypothetical protein
LQSEEANLLYKRSELLKLTWSNFAVVLASLFDEAMPAESDSALLGYLNLVDGAKAKATGTMHEY